MKTAIYPGSFDPITNGHLDVVRRAAKLFDRVIVAVAENADKQPLFTPQERVELVQAAVRGLRGVVVDHFRGLLVDYARRKKAVAIVRGLRAVSDFEYELQFALMNRKLAPQVETIFLAPKDEYTFVSSRMIKEIARLGGNIGCFVPREVLVALRRKLSL
ncbi:MAG: pantetheine-phosphate adenylyltransferase [Verrucomicrobia bacterium]|nr:pantetheine-phosphate adenylyltransferase [Verrucomicrobiota bacterium]